MLIRTFRSFLITGILYNFNRYFIICFSLSWKLNYVNYNVLFNIKPDIRIPFIPYKSDHTNSISESRRHHLIQFEGCCLKIIFGSPAISLPEKCFNCSVTRGSLHRHNSKFCQVFSIISIFPITMFINCSLHWPIIQG